MPEGVEIEIYRRHAAETVGRTVKQVLAPDDWFLKRGTTATEVQDAATGATVEAARRRGKLLVLDLKDRPSLGLRFGMTGRLIVDGGASIEYLEYSSRKNDPKWDRFGLVFDDGTDLVIRDPRRLGGVELDPDESALGPDAFAITLGQLRDGVAVGTVAIKARLLDQGRIAGVGNLIADETLWRAGIDPARPSDSLEAPVLRRLHYHLKRVLDDFLTNGGSHTGRLQPHRQRGAQCPVDGAPLLRRKVGGRTTYSCSEHQV